eukprot:UN05845
MIMATSIFTSQEWMFLALEVNSKIMSAILIGELFTLPIAFAILVYMVSKLEVITYYTLQYRHYVDDKFRYHVLGMYFDRRETAIHRTVT